MKVIGKYPEIYRVPIPNQTLPDQAQGALADDYCNLRSGFECGPGWQALIEQLSSIASELVAQLKASGWQSDAFIKAQVVKQKLGELRWLGHDNLCSPFNRLWLAYLAQARRESSQTCEISGEPGKIRHLDGFMICLSDKEFRKWKRSRLQQRLLYWQLQGIPPAPFA